MPRRSGYKPIDEEAYHLFVKISQWTRRWRMHDGALTSKLVREYLKLGAYTRREANLERRIFQESGRIGAYEKKRQRLLQKKREAAKKLKERQFTFDL